MIDRSLHSYRDDLRRVIVRIKITLHRNRVIESTTDNLLLAAIKDRTEAELVFSNG